PSPAGHPAETVSLSAASGIGLSTHLLKSESVSIRSRNVAAVDPIHGTRTQVRVTVGGRGAANVATGMSVLGHFLALLARSASLDLALEVAPGPPGEEVRAAGRAFGESLRTPLREEGIRGHGSAVVPSAEALAHVVLEASEESLLVSNVDLSAARVGGVATDVVDAFLRELVE